MSKTLSVKCLFVRNPYFVQAWLILAVMFLLMGVLHAQSIGPRPKVTVPEIDQMPAEGKFFTDPRWSQPDVVPFPLVAPCNVTFAHPPEATQVRALWCKDYLLLRFDCQDQSIITLPGKEAADNVRDLPYFQADSVEVFMDPVGDGRMYMEFQFNPHGGVFDAIYFCTTTLQYDASYMLTGDVVNNNLFTINEWNLNGLKTAARIWPQSEGKGWSVIAAFPAKEILKRYGKTELAAGMELKANLVRFNYFPDKKIPFEVTNWAPVNGGCAHISPAGMGTLVLGPAPSPK